MKFPFVQISRVSAGTGDLRIFWTLQIPDFEAMLENHQNWYALEILTEGSLDQGKCGIKILWKAEDGKVIKLELEVAKSRSLGRISLISPQGMVIQN